jgi:hypothetical protein
MLPTCLLVLLSADALNAGAWTQPLGTGFYKLGSQMLRGNDYYDRDGNSVLIPTQSEYTLSLYAEFGVRDDLTLVAYVPFYQRITLNRQIGRDSGFVYFGGDAAQGIADSEVGARYRLWQNGSGVVSAALSFGLPVGDDSHPNGLYTGDGEFNQRLSLLFGRSLYPWPGYFSMGVAYNIRHSGYDDVLRFSAEAGRRWQRLSVTLRVEALESVDNGDASVHGGAGGLYGNDRRYVGAGVELGTDVAGDLHLSLGLLRGFRLHNAIDAPTISVGLSTSALLRIEGCTFS